MTDAPDAAGASPAADEKPKLETEVVIGKDRAINFLATEAASYAYDRLRRDEARWRIVLASTVTVLGLLGYATLTATVGKPIEERLEGQLGKFQAQQRTEVEQLRRAVEDARSQLAGAQTTIPQAIDDVRKQIEPLRIELSADLALVKLARLAQEVESKDGFTNAERDAMIEQLELAGKDARIRSRSEFSRVLESILDSFVEAGLDQYVDRIDDTFGTEAFRSKGIVTTMLGYYGEYLLASPQEPAQWSSAAMARFEKYAAAARNLRIQESCLPLEILIEYRLARPSSPDVIRRMLDGGLDLNSKSQAAFLATLIRYTAPDFWMVAPRASARQIAKISSGFCKEYEPELKSYVQLDETRSAIKDLADRMSKAKEKTARNLSKRLLQLIE